MASYRRRIFPLLALALWFAFLTLDLTRWGSSTQVKFAAICLCCVTALLGAKTTDGRLVAAALCFTVGADWFLLIRDAHYALGVWLFIIVQLFYAHRLHLFRGKKHHTLRWAFRLTTFILVLCSPVPMFATIAPVEFGDFISNLFPLENVLYLTVPLLPFFYFLNLCVNTFEAFALKKHIFALGLLLFVCCDVCVGAYNLHLLPALSFPGMWFFYLPSQVLIVLSQEEGDNDEKAL